MNDLQAAAERLRGANAYTMASPDGQSWYPSRERESDLVRVAEFALPLVDGTPLTKQMLIAAGGKKQDNHLKVTFFREDSLPLGFWECDDGWKVMLLIDTNFACCVVRGIKTLGDFKLRARALAIELTAAETKGGE